MKNDTDIACKDSNFGSKKWTFYYLRMPNRRLASSNKKFKLDLENLKEPKKFSFFIIQHGSNIRDTGNRFKIDSGFSCNFGRHKSECVCIHEILSLCSKFNFHIQKISDFQKY